MTKSNRKKLEKNISHKKGKAQGLIILGLLVFLAGIIVYGPVLNSDDKMDYSSFEGEIITDSMVCMLRGDIKSRPTLPIEINSKTYWGCCQNCLGKLMRNENNALFALDPFSGQSVDKADAIIRQDPQNNKRVFFFKSNETYNQYLKIINKK
ncbi:hypothetical protein EV201_3115 [Ancylomarina subtilis]|uniref:TRASH domain-containing protein n=1 Tax=Ancylomarina subtilis TaxID=1639035 RepID=A0A4Q7V4C0_9BACT|nr:hypothetical protein [Ancylomarina subtilis]RZT91301.1 hypothetical protein EV201_3115 [Ancylomarina subtilis]